MSKTGFRCKIPRIPGIHPEFTLTLRPGYTAIVGPNGAGKTRLLNQIKDVAAERGYGIFYYSGPERCSSLPTFGKLFPRDAESNETSTPVFIFLDDVDAGVSANRLIQTMDVIHELERMAGIHSGGANHELYIIAAVNSYTMAKNICVDVRTGKSRVFCEYGYFERFMCDYFETHRNG